MSKRRRQHVNPLKVGYLSRRPVLPVDLPATGEVEVELGCADAQFLFGRAAALPGLTCVGLEIKRDLVAQVNQRAALAGLPNLRAVFANVNRDLSSLFPDARLARVYLNFPDPWFKLRHHKRRVLTPEVVATVARQLEPRGLLFFQSDVFELALDAMEILEAEGPALGLHNRLGPWSFTRDNPFGARSQREERCEDKGMRIWRIAYEKSVSLSSVS